EAVRPRLDRAMRERGARPSGKARVGETGVQDLLALAAVAEDGDAETALAPGEEIGLGHVALPCLLGEIDRLRDTVVRVALEGRLMPHVPAPVNLVRGL